MSVLQSLQQGLTAPLSYIPPGEAVTGIDRES